MMGRRPSTQRFPSPRDLSVRAFTLLELMVVIALMLGIAAVVVPLTLADAGRAALRESHHQLEATLLAARADAQRSARVVRVAAAESSEPGRWILLTEEVPARSTVETDLEAVPRPRVLRDAMLPAGVRIARSKEDAAGVVPENEPVDADGRTGAGGAAGAEAEPLDGPALDEAVVEARNEIQIAIFLPDGQMTPTRPLYVGRKGDARVSSVHINAWTGAVTVELMPVVTPDEREQPEPDVKAPAKEDHGDRRPGPVMGGEGAAAPVGVRG